MRTRSALLLLVLAATPALAVLPDEILADQALEARAREISTGLRCLVCQNQSIDDSDADLARDLRIVIRERLTAGDSDLQAVDFVVARYGEYVLLKPRFSAKTAVLWLGPFALLAGAALFLWRRRPATSLAESALTAEEKAALERVKQLPQ